MDRAGFIPAPVVIAYCEQLDLDWLEVLQDIRVLDREFLTEMKERAKREREKQERERATAKQGRGHGRR